MDPQKDDTRIADGDEAGSGPRAGRSRIGATAKAGALVAAGLIAGGVAAGAMSASADTSSPSATPPAGGAAAPSSNGAAAPGVNGGHGGSRPLRSDETAVTGADLATLKAAALKAVPGGTVYRVESDAGDGKYEAHMTKADGSLATVKFDANLAVTRVEPGMGSGDPAPAGPSA